MRTSLTPFSLDLSRVLLRSKTNELWRNQLRDWPTPQHGVWKTGQQPKWKHPNAS